MLTFVNNDSGQREKSKNCELVRYVWTAATFVNCEDGGDTVFKGFKVGTQSVVADLSEHNWIRNGHSTHSQHQSLFFSVAVIEIP